MNHRPTDEADSTDLHGCIAYTIRDNGRYNLSKEMPTRTTKRLGTFRIGSPRSRGEGLRVGTVRFLPRGVKKEDYARLDYFDVWFPLLAPSPELLQWVRRGKWSSEQVRWSKFRQRYTVEMNKTNARQAIQLLAALARAAPLSIGCYCEDESACHRSILRELIQDATVD